MPVKIQKRSHQQPGMDCRHDRRGFRSGRGFQQREIGRCHHFQKRVQVLRLCRQPVIVTGGNRCGLHRNCAPIRLPAFGDIKPLHGQFNFSGQWSGCGAGPGEARKGDRRVFLPGQKLKTLQHPLCHVIEAEKKQIIGLMKRQSGGSRQIYNFEQGRDYGVLVAGRVGMKTALADHGFRGATDYGRDIRQAAQQKIRFAISQAAIDEFFDRDIDPGLSRFHRAEDAQRLIQRAGPHERPDPGHIGQSLGGGDHSVAITQRRQGLDAQLQLGRGFAAILFSGQGCVEHFQRVLRFAKIQIGADQCNARTIGRGIIPVGFVDQCKGFFRLVLGNKQFRQQYISPER